MTLGLHRPSVRRDRAGKTGSPPLYPTGEGTYLKGMPV